MLHRYFDAKLKAGVIFFAFGKEPGKAWFNTEGENKRTLKEWTLEEWTLEYMFKPSVWPEITYEEAKLIVPDIPGPTYEPPQYMEKSSSPEKFENVMQQVSEKLTKLLQWCKQHEFIRKSIDNAITKHEIKVNPIEFNYRTWKNLSYYALSPHSINKELFFNLYDWAEQEMKNYTATASSVKESTMPPEEEVIVGPIEHFQVPLIVKMLKARTRNGFRIPLWLYGAPGAGKTTLGEQIANNLGLRHSPLALGPTTTESKTVGYRNLINGEFVEGHCYKTYKEGGLCHLDEIDVADAGVLVSLNSILANETYMFPSGELVKRHPDFTVMATANTIGTGAMHGFTRNRLDAATLDRFVKFKLQYDVRLERWLADNAAWVKYVTKVRSFLEQHVKETCYVTPRASMNGAALLREGIIPSLVAEVCIFNAMSESIAANIKKECGIFTPTPGFPI